jgi:RHS repeat-associated protein
VARVRGIGLFVVLFGICLIVGPSSAVAEPLCTDTWSGASAGAWGTASNWSAAHVPGSSDVACIGAGKTVTVSEGSNQVAAVEAEGALTIAGGSLELTSALEPSNVAALTLEHATLTGVGTLNVTGTLSWEREGTMSGSGKTVLKSGASATVLPNEAACEGVLLTGRTFVNEGVVTFSSNYSTGGSIALSEGARLENKGTFHDNSAAWYCSGWEYTIVQAPGSKVAPLLINTGSFDVTESSHPEFAAKIAVPVENLGTLDAKAGGLGFANVPVTLASGSALKGAFQAVGTTIATGSVLGAGAALTLSAAATLTVGSGSTATVGSFSFEEATISGAGTFNILTSLTWERGGTMSGSGKTILEGGATANVLTTGPAWCEGAHIAERTFVNDGTVHFGDNEVNTGGTLVMSRGAQLDNNGTFYDNSKAWYCSPWLYNIIETGANKRTKIVNLGSFRRTENSPAGFVTKVAVPFENSGATSGEIEFLYNIGAGSSAWGCTAENPSFPKREIATEAGICTASGDLSETQTDFTIGGRGLGLNLIRTYNSQAAEEKAKSIFGYGWSTPHSQHLTFETIGGGEVEEGEEPEPEIHVARLIQDNGSTVEFVEGAGGTWKGPEGSPDILTGSTSSGFTLTLESQETWKFSGSTGRLEGMTDRNGNTTAFTYNGGGQLEKVSDPGGRSLTFAYNGEGLVKTVTDPMGHVVEYTYESGKLMSVTQPGEAGLRWRFSYEGESQLVEMVDGRGEVTTYKYSAAHRVTSKTDPMKRTTAFEYGNTFALITNEATGAKTADYTTSNGQLVEVVHGLGTASATTESFTYDAAGNKLSSTDGNGHTTKFEYDAHGNRILQEDPEGNKTKWTYDSTHDVETTTLPNGETTTTKRDSHGNPEAIERPAPGSTTQITKYGYDAHGELTSLEDPLKRVWKYEYDANGDRIAEVDPEGDKRTWGYNADSQETSTVSPRGHVGTGKEAKFTTTTERDAQGRPVVVVAPLKHETKYKYDGDGNLETKTDPELNVVTYTYDADNEQTKVKEPNEDVSETSYDGAGQVTSETNGAKHTTTYVRNVLEQVTEIKDSLSRRTTKAYDLAGNLVSVEDAKKRTTTYAYDSDNRRREITHSDGVTPTVKYEYNENGDRTKMVDGSGTTTYAYDQLDRLTGTTDGHGNSLGYEYDLANEQTRITYPGSKAVTRAYDSAGRLKSTTDWSEHTTKFTYNADSNLIATVFPTGTGDEDVYGYDEAGAMSEDKMTKGTETLASLVYARDKDGQVTKATTVGLPGEEKPAFAYDKNSRITKGAGIAYKYDAANDPTTIGSTTYSYDAANQLEKATLAKATTATYGYDEVGERVKTTPTTGSATTYAYDQANDLTSVTRPKEGATPAIEDAYAYNGDGLRVQQTISGASSYLAWDLSEKLPQIVGDGANSYVYGAGGFPVERISSEGTTIYMHHDQQGSTRLLTGASGTVVGTATYDAYGNKIGSTGTGVTSLGYDGQYTDADTALIYLRARYYDPKTGQFISNDPQVMETREPYSYTVDDPLSTGDPTGLTPWSKKVKHAIARCQSWKNWHSHKSPFYGNKNIYLACQDLLSLPPEVFGTGGQGGGSISAGEQVGLMCGLGGAPTYLVTRSLRGGADAAAAAGTFCFGYDAGTLIVRPLLHDILPTVFE